MAFNSVYSQIAIKGKVIDATTNQPIQGVTVSTSGDRSNAITDKNGNFTIHTASDQDSIRFTSVGYSTNSIAASRAELFILLSPAFANLNEIVVSGSRDIQRRTEVPVAISVISRTMINHKSKRHLQVL